METSNSPLQHPRMKATPPPPPQSTTPRPSTSANSTSPTAHRPTGSAGQSGASTTPRQRQWRPTMSSPTTQWAHNPSPVLRSHQLLQQW
eukprot:1618251-Amphidinium_carterae.1